MCFASFSDGFVFVLLREDLLVKALGCGVKKHTVSVLQAVVEQCRVSLWEFCKDVIISILDKCADHGVLSLCVTASQPSLLSGTSQSAGSNLSKKAVLNQSLISSTESQLPDPAAPASQPPVVRRQKDTLVLGQSLDTASPVFGDKENASPLSPLSPAGGASSESGRKPSYLKLSCAVSGYGKYSRYSSYKNIPTRSPFSSTSSLRSDLSSPDPTMPSLRSPDDSRSPIALQSAGCSPSGAGVMATTLSNGQSRLLAPALNGHAAAQAPGMYPTGDPVKVRGGGSCVVHWMIMCKVDG